MSETPWRDSPLTLALVVPVDGVSEVTLRELNARELAKLTDDSEKFGGVRAMISMISAVSHVEVATVERMGTRDFEACAEYLNSFSRSRTG